MASNREQFTTEIYVNQDQANEAMGKLQAQVEKTAKSFEKLQKTEGENSIRTQQAKKRYEDAKRALEGAKTGTENYARALKNLSSQSMNTLLRMQKQLNEELKRYKPNTKEWKELATQLKQVNDRINSLRNGFKGVATEQGKASRSIAAGWAKAASAIGVAVAALRKFAQTYKIITNFEQANANLASILGATSDQMERMEQAAIKLGSASRFTATQVTALQTELAKMGFTTDQIIRMQKAVLNFAGSVGADLAGAAQMAGVALRSFDLTATQTEDALGTMAVACNKSALSFTYLHYAFSTVAPVAKTYGLTLKDTTALLGALANAGFDASSAATATRNILLNLANANGELAKALGGSVSSFDEIIDAMIKLREEGVDLNEALELTDKRSVAAFSTFLSGAENARELRGALEDVNGELQRMADERAATVEGAIDGMNSAWEGLVLSFRGSKGAFKEVFDTIAFAIRGLDYWMGNEGAYDAMFGKKFEKNLAIIKQSAKDQTEAMKMMEQYYNSERQRLMAQAAANQRNRNGLPAAYDEGMKRLAEQQAHALNTVYNAAMEEMKAAAEEAKETTEETTKETTKLTEEELKKQQAAALKAYNEKKKQMDAAYNYEVAAMKVKWLQGETGEAEYNAATYKAKQQYYADLLKLARIYGQDNTAILNKMMDDHIKALEAQKKRVKEEMEEMAQYNAAPTYSPTAPQEGGINDAKAAADFRKKIEEKAAAIRAEVTEETARQAYETEVRWAEKLAEKRMITAEEAEKYILKAKIKYAQQAVEQIQSINEMASDAVDALRNAELASLEANYQKQLTAAGDNAEKRAEIEKQMEEKKLEIQKRYADADMVINIAKTIAAGALAVVQAFAQLGPVAGAVAAALIGVTTAAEVASIVAQRNAIKNTSVNTSSYSSSSQPKTGTRSVTGYAQGGYTENHTTFTTVGERGTEWIAPSWMVRRNPVVFANLERYRQQGGAVQQGSVATGFADGGYAGGSAPTGNYTEAELEAAIERAVRRSMANGAIRAVVVRKDITELDEQDARIKQQTTL